MATRRRPRRTAAQRVTEDGTRIAGDRPDTFINTEERKEARHVVLTAEDIPEIKHFVLARDAFIGGVYMRAIGQDDDPLVHSVPISVSLPSTATVTDEDGTPLEDLPPEPESREYKLKMLDKLQADRAELEARMESVARELDEISEDEGDEEPDEE